ncbi:hypothetical protein [Alcanivorax sp. 1008]|uniref:hypothetical protein n=1 Tax=Alcanivorax sp. 1008 TaxID=2816853 RepID=UPI001D762B95|nr:hypothetical protein [Alcanivorax sp. 1008]MCC1497799.1 hypothetical protein [Alcanivorax sp. 1008]
MRIFLLATLALLTAAQSLAQGSDGFIMRPLTEMTASSAFGQGFANHQYSVGTTVNQRGNLIGYQLTEAGQWRSFNVTPGSNPALLIVDTPDFIALAAGEPVCVWIFCSTALPWGVMLTLDGPVGQFVARDRLLAPLAGSLPDSSFPGAFVNGNRHGVVASSQLSDTGRFGAIVFNNGVVTLSDAPWLTAINDNVPAQVLAYHGNDADCLISAVGCEPPAPVSCHKDGDRHANTRGKGHHSHGKGHGYGHYRCGRGKPGSNSYRGIATSADFTTSTVATDSAGAGSSLITVAADGVISRLQFPSELISGEGLSKLYPLALNNRTAVLRADIHGSTVWPGRLLRCDFDPLQQDGNADGVVDCIAGLRMIETAAIGIQVRTVFGFSLNNQGLLVGNSGFAGAGIGVPFLLDLNQPGAEAELLANRLIGAEGWELASVNDLNDGRRGIGHGYLNCGDSAQAVALMPLGGLDDSLGFGAGDWLHLAGVAPGQNYEIAPQAKGGSGQYLYRYSARRAGDGDWKLLQDWSADALQATAGAQSGDVCHRIQLADAISQQHRELIVRLRVSAGSSVPVTPLLRAAP